MSLEQLSHRVVTSVSKAPQRLSQAPAAIYVITHGQIVRSGAKNLVEALRLAPKADSASGSRSDAPPASPAVAAGPTCSQLIAVTGWGQQEDRERSRAAGFDHHLTKPIDTDTLQRLLSESSSRLHRAADRRG